MYDGYKNVHGNLLEGESLQGCRGYEYPWILSMFGYQT